MGEAQTNSAGNGCQGRELVWGEDTKSVGCVYSLRAILSWGGGPHEGWREIDA